MASTLKQMLFLGGLPEGLSMTITDIKPSVPEGTLKSKDWRVRFNGSGNVGVSIDDAEFEDSFSKWYPITVATSTADGLIGTAVFESQHPFTSHGPGGKVDITFRIQGTTNSKGKSYTFDQKGFISVSTSNWFLTTRPDEVYITYSLIDTPPGFLKLSVPASIAGQPADVYFVFVVSADGKRIGVTTTEHKEMIKKILDGTIETIFWAHTKVLKWVAELFM